MVEKSGEFWRSKSEHTNALIRQARKQQVQFCFLAKKYKKQKLMDLQMMYTQNKLVCEKFIYQCIHFEYNGDRIICLDEDMSIIVFE